MRDQCNGAWTSADTYAAQVACRVLTALQSAGVCLHELDDPGLEKALIRQAEPLTVRQLAIAAQHADKDPSVWLRRARPRNPA